jgi:hypothetical protein
MSENMLDRMPDIMSENMLGRMPDIMSEYVSDRIEYQFVGIT